MYDLAIIGAGVAGIACAKIAAKYGFKILLLEENREAFGGTCLNKGCIPTKFFLNSSKLNKNWQEIFKEKNEVIEKIKTPCLNYLKNKGVEIVWGQTSFLDEHTLKINGKEKAARNIIVACGSTPAKILDYDKAIFAQELFSQPTIPEKFLIVGAGSAGVELASLLNGLGKTVCVVEKEKTILPSFDCYLTSRLRIILQKKGIKIETEKDALIKNYEEFDMIISSVGRVPNIKDLGMEKIGLSQNANGWIKTDEFMKTNLEGIYACGDITGKKLLAYVAEYQAGICIKNIMNTKDAEDYSGIPECVFSSPQIAQVGILEDEARAKNLKYRVIKSNFLKFSSSYVYNDNDGFIELLVNEEDRIIGAGIISLFAAELINILSLCIKNNLTLSDLKKNVFIHPTLSEIIPLLLLV